MANKDKQKNFTGTVRCANYRTFSSVTTAGCYIRLHHPAIGSYFYSGRCFEYFYHLLHILYPAGLRNILPQPPQIKKECIIIIIINIVKVTNKMQLYRLLYYLLIYSSCRLVSWMSFAHHQEHLTIFTVSGSIHPRCCRLVSWMSFNSSKTPARSNLGEYYLIQ